MTMRLQVDDDVIYEGAPIAVPGVGDAIRRNGEDVRVEARTWEFGDVVVVTLLTGARPYTF
jgi:hypothetical protein